MMPFVKYIDLLYINVKMKVINNKELSFEYPTIVD